MSDGPLLQFRPGSWATTITYSGWRRPDGWLVVRRCRTSGVLLAGGAVAALPDEGLHPDCCRTFGTPGSVKGRRSRSRSDAAGALDGFRRANGQSAAGVKDRPRAGRRVVPGPGRESTRPGHRGQDGRPPGVHG